MTLRSALAAIANHICPEPCPRCDSAPADGFCAACRVEFTRVEAPCCRCGLPAPCHPCPADGERWQIERIFAPFVYAPPLNHYLRALKFSGQRLLGAAFGRMLADELGRGRLDCDLLCCVPLHRRRLINRSFNQADEIARPIAARHGLRLLAGGVGRRVDSVPQSRLGRADRLAGLRGAFTVGCRLDGLQLAIVDDVITTGATVNALAAELRAAGAAGVIAVAVARTTGAEAAALKPA